MLKRTTKRNRAWRRYQYKKARNCVKRKWIFISALECSCSLTSKQQAQWLGVLSRTSKVCSCPACGNPRRHFDRRSFTERRQMG